MLFWIVLAVLVLSIVVSLIYAFVGDRYSYHAFDNGTAAAFIILIVGGLVGGAIMLACIGGALQASGKPEFSHKYGLRALVTKEQTSTQGSAIYFLGFGSAQFDSKTKRVIAYIRQGADGGSTLRQTTIDRAVIYEDLAPGQPAYVEDWVTVQKVADGKVVPWAVSGVKPGEPQHRFHIPKGTILENYEVAP